MSILLYCVAAKAGLPQLGTGVAGLPVLRSECREIVGFFSNGTSAETWTGVPLRESARHFHQVLQKAFEAGAIIPFRFPTLLANEKELAAFLGENSSSYAAMLQEFRNSAQMEAVISYSDNSRPAGASSSGAEYLRGRQKRFEELQTVFTELQRCAGDTAKAWRNRSAQNTLRAFALLERGSITAFKQKLCGFSVPAGSTVRVTGPWPVSEFLDIH